MVDERIHDRQSAGLAVWVVVGAFAVGAAALTLLATRRGVIVDQDSATYLSAARNLASGRGYQDFTGTALTNFPPLFPAVIRAGMWVLPSAATAARVVNAAAFAGAVVLAFLLLRRHVQSRVIVVGATLLVASSIGLLHSADKALSEPVSWVFALGYLLVLESALTSTGRRSTGLFAIAGVLFGCAFLTRYAAIGLIAVGVGAILVFWWRTRAPGLIGRLLTLVATASILPVLWIARNAATDNKNILGPRVGSGVGPITLIRTTAKGVGSVFLPQNLARFNEAFFWVLVVVAVGAVIVLPRLRVEGGEAKTTLVPLSLFILVYIPFSAWTNATAGAALDFRIFSPIYMPIVVVFASFVDDVCQWAKRANKNSLRNAVLAGGVLLVGVATVGAVYDAWHLSRTAHGYAAPAFTSSALAHSVEALPADALVASNDPYKLYGVTGRQPLVLSPGVEAPGISLSPVSLAALTQHAICHGPVYLAWYGPTGKGPPYLQEPEQLALQATLVTADTLNDGTLFRLAPATDKPKPTC